MNYFDVIFEMHRRLREEGNQELLEIRLDQQTYRDFYEEIRNKMNFIPMTTNNQGISCITLFGIKILPAQQTEFKTKEYKKTYIDFLYTTTTPSPVGNYDLSFLRTRE